MGTDDLPVHVYKYGGEFPARPDNIRFEDVDGVARIRDLKIMEDRIRDAIAHGYVTGKDGSIINILNNEPLLILDTETASTNIENVLYDYITTMRTFSSGGNCKGQENGIIEGENLIFISFLSA